VNPDGTLLELPAAPGLLVGTTANGGSANLGALFSILPDGDNFQIVHDFGVVAADGRNPTTGLVQAPNGWLLGTTRVGGAANQGVIYQVNPLVTSVTTVHTFTATAGDAARSRGALVSAGSGIYYGTTFGGGTNDQGALFRLFNP
jgi:hypothetical protein